jgi:hypothetical protein
MIRACDDDPGLAGAQEWRPMICADDDDPGLAGAQEWRP